MRLKGEYAVKVVKLPGKCQQIIISNYVKSSSAEHDKISRSKCLEVSTALLLSGM